MTSSFIVGKRRLSVFPVQQGGDCRRLLQQSNGAVWELSVAAGSNSYCASVSLSAVNLRQRFHMKHICLCFMYNLCVSQELLCMFVYSELNWSQSEFKHVESHRHDINSYSHMITGTHLPVQVWMYEPGFILGSDPHPSSSWSITDQRTDQSVCRILISWHSWDRLQHQTHRPMWVSDCPLCPQGHRNLWLLKKQSEEEELVMKSSLCIYSICCLFSPEEDEDAALLWPSSANS